MSFSLGDIWGAVTAPVRAIAGAVEGIASGDNVVDSVKGAITGVIAGPTAVIDATTGHVISNMDIPLVSQNLKSAYEASNDPFNPGNQGRLYQQLLKTGGTIAGGYYGGSALSGFTGLAPGASQLLAGKISYDLSRGNLAGALQAGLGAIGPIDFGYGQFDPGDLVSQFAGQVGRLPASPVNSIQSPAQTVVMGPKTTGANALFIILGVSAGAYLLWRMKK